MDTSAGYLCLRSASASVPKRRHRSCAPNAWHVATLRVGVDVGGTFTDLVAVDLHTGDISTVKVPSTPQSPERGVLDALDALFARYETAPTIEYFGHSTTIATNALLGQIHLELPRVALITTYGFRDIIEIGRQNRSQVYNLFVTRPTPLVAREDRITVRERISYDGTILEPLSDADILHVLEHLRARDIESVAIGFLHSYVNDTHECRMADAIAKAFPSLPITRSAELNPEYREFERFSTAVVNATLMPIVQRYLDRLQRELRDRHIDAPLFVMQSNGGMAAVSRVATRPAAIIESGPASGVIAAAQLGLAGNCGHLISFDMGGTTAKAGTIVDGIVQIAAEFEAAGASHSGRSTKGSGYPVRFPFVDLAEISAGGGTVAWIDDAGSLRVGPLSAGADPGPACYGTSDRATVTDANVVLGRLNQTHLLGGTFPIDAARSRAAVQVLADRIGLSLQATASGIVRLVDSEMAKILRIVTIERGLDPRDFSMIAFGGNGPLHACALAEELGVARIFVPLRPGVFSAHGLLIADVRVSESHPIMQATDRLDVDQLRATAQLLHTRTLARLREQGAVPDTATLQTYDARYRGQSFELEISPDGSTADIARSFHRKHEERYGYSVPNESVEIVTMRVTATGRLREPPPNEVVASEGRRERVHTRSTWNGRDFEDVPTYMRSELHEGERLTGPALIEQYDTCTYLAHGWQLRNERTMLVLEPS